MIYLWVSVTTVRGGADEEVEADSESVEGDSAESE